jgi:hypothetical protein
MHQNGINFHLKDESTFSNHESLVFLPLIPKLLNITSYSEISPIKVKKKKIEMISNKNFPLSQINWSLHFIEALYQLILLLDKRLQDKIATGE